MLQKISRNWEAWRSHPRILKFNQLVLLHRQERPNDVWCAVGISVLLGALYGIFVRPYWSEAVDFGQMWAGLLDYRYSYWAQTAMKEPSLQIVVPALFMKAGSNAWILSLVASAFFCATSFAAIAAASFAFSRNALVSTMLPLMLISYNFANSHGYPAEYPISYFQFGQTGQYLALFAISMAACGWPVAAGIAGGLLSGVHAVWCAAFVIGVFPIVGWLQRPLFKRLLVVFLITMVGTLTFQIYGESQLPPKPQYVPPLIPEVAATAAAASTDMPSLDKKKVRGTMLGHNVLFADAASPAKAAIIFFLPTALFILLVSIFYFAQLRLESLRSHWSSAKRLILMVTIPLLLAGTYKIFEEFDPNLTLFKLLDERLPNLILRAIINRWTNLASLLIPIMTVGLLSILAWDSKSWLACLGLAIILKLSLESWHVISPSEMDQPESAWGLIICLFLYVFYLVWKKKVGPLRPPDRGQIVFVGAAFLLFFVAQVRIDIHEIQKYRRYTGSDAADPLVAIAKADQGQLIVSSGVVSAQDGFNPQLRTGRPIVVPLVLDVYDQASKAVVHVFCFVDQSVSFQAFYANIKPCFENRSVHEWAVVGKETHSTGIITPDDWNLKIQPIISAGGFSYYRLQLN